MDCSPKLEKLFGVRNVRCFPDRPSDLNVMFTTMAHRHAERAALKFDEGETTYRELDTKVTALASNFQNMQLSPGARVALFLENEPEFVVAVLASIRAGLIVVPMNVRQAPRETAYIVNHCQASLIICGKDQADRLPEGSDIPSVKRIFLTGDDVPQEHSFNTLTKAPEASFQVPRINEEDCFCLLYTSGTTGKPKGAMLTHVGVIHSVLTYQRAYNLGPDDVGALAVPASHATGLIAILLTMLTCGGCSVLMKRFKADTFLKLAQDECVSFALLVPAMYNLCLLEPDVAEYDLSRWRVAGFGGAPMPQATISKMAELFPGLELSNVYGSTETSSPSTLLPLGEIGNHPDSVGKPVPCADIIFVNDEGEVVSAGNVGELLIGGPMVVPGYWENPEGNKVGFDLEGRWRSGDIGFMDEHGYVHVVDRKKDIVNRGGYKIYCIEVEGVLAQHQDVVEAALLGVSDPVLGEKAVAYVYLSTSDVVDEELRQHCASHLSNYKIPDRIIQSPSPLPRNANGKILKTDLRKAASSLQLNT